MFYTQENDWQQIVTCSQLFSINANELNNSTNLSIKARLTTQTYNNNKYLRIKMISHSILFAPIGSWHKFPDIFVKKDFFK